MPLTSTSEARFVSRSRHGYASPAHSSLLVGGGGAHAVAEDAHDEVGLGRLAHEVIDDALGGLAHLAGHAVFVGQDLDHAARAPGWVGVDVLDGPFDDLALGGDVTRGGQE